MIAQGVPPLQIEKLYLGTFFLLRNLIRKLIILFFFFGVVSVRGRGDSLEGPSLPPFFLPCRCHPSLSASLVPLAQAAPVPA